MEVTVKNRDPYDDPGAVLIILYNHKEGKVLVVQNTKHLRPKCKFPAGHIKHGESPLVAAIRELWEETSQVVGENCLRELLDPIDKGNHFLYIYGAIVEDFIEISKGLIKDGDALLETKLLSPREILGLVDFLPTHRKIFKNILFKKTTPKVIPQIQSSAR